MSIRIRDFLRSDGSIIINKRLARILGIDAAIMYSEIISKWIYYNNTDKLENDGSFFSTIEDMESDTTLSVRQQTRAIKILTDFELIEYKVRGLPPRRFFKLPDSEESLMKILEVKNQFTQNAQIQAGQEFTQNAQIVIRKTHRTIYAKRTTNNTNNNTKTNNTKKDQDQNIAAKAASSQQTLFSLPESNPAPLNRIEEAKASGDWRKVKPTDFADYFIKRHNEIFPTKIQRQKSKRGNYLIGIFRKNFLERYEIKPEETCHHIDLILEIYKISSVVKSEYRDRFDFEAFEQEWLISKLMNRIQDLDEINNKKSPETTGEIF